MTDSRSTDECLRTEEMIHHYRELSTDNNAYQPVDRKSTQKKSALILISASVASASAMMVGCAIYPSVSIINDSLPLLRGTVEIGSSIVKDFWNKDGTWNVNVSNFRDDQWQELMRDYFIRFGREVDYQFNSPQYLKRLEIFKKNALYILQHNLNHPNNIQNFESVYLAPNSFMDLDWNEFRQKHLTLNSRKAYQIPSNVTLRHGGYILTGIAEQTFPESIDWVKAGCVTPVKDQRDCGSCWAFSATGAIEGAVCAQTGKLYSLSEQQLIECGELEGTHGCNGGFMDNAFQYVLDNHGICSEEDYPYQGRNMGSCRSNQCQNKVTIKGFVDVPSRNEKALKAAVAFYGPVAAAIQADRPVMQFYHRGVMNLQKCGKHLNHAVLIVGYGQDNGEHFWLIKNSWGSAWGDGGYVKLSRDVHKKNGECGVLLAPTVPLVD